MPSRRLRRLNAPLCRLNLNYYNELVPANRSNIAAYTEPLLCRVGLQDDTQAEDPLPHVVVADSIRNTCTPSTVVQVTLLHCQHKI